MIWLQNEELITQSGSVLTQTAIPPICHLMNKYYMFFFLTIVVIAPQLRKKKPIQLF